MTETQSADIGLRRRAIRLLLLAALGAALCVHYLQRERDAIVNWFIQNAEYFAKYPESIGLASFIFQLPIIGLSVYLFKFGRLIVREKRFPPSGTKVLKEARVWCGKSAIVRGYLVQLVSVVLIVSIVLSCAALWYFFRYLAFIGIR